MEGNQQGVLEQNQNVLSLKTPNFVFNWRQSRQSRQDCPIGIKRTTCPP